MTILVQTKGFSWPIHSGSEGTRLFPTVREAIPELRRPPTRTACFSWGRTTTAWAPRSARRSRTVWARRAAFRSGRDANRSRLPSGNDLFCHSFFWGLKQFPFKVDQPEKEGGCLFFPWKSTGHLSIPISFVQAARFFVFAWGLSLLLGLSTEPGGDGLIIEQGEMDQSISPGVEDGGNGLIPLGKMRRTLGEMNGGFSPVSSGKGGFPQGSPFD